MSFMNTLAYCSAVYFGAKYYHFDIDGFLLKCAHKFVFLLSHIQIYIQNNSYFNIFQQLVRSFRKNIKNRVDVVKFNDTIYKTSPEKLIENPPTFYDIIVYSNENDTTNKTDKVIFNSIPKIDLFQYNTCNYSFIQISITIDNIVHKIEFRTNEYNYYIVGNRVNANLLGYYLHKHSKVSYDMENTEYSLMIIDQDAKTIYLTEKDELVFDENNYTILQNAADNFPMENEKSVSDE